MQQHAPRATRNTTVAIATGALVAALVVTLFVLHRPSGTTGAAAGTRLTTSANGIFHTGDAWTVGVRQNSGRVTPDGSKRLSTVNFRFRVAAGPATRAGAWTVVVMQDGAEGPFAKGWRLFYAERGPKMVLTKVAMGGSRTGTKPMEAEVASIILGTNFPYETAYAKPPVSHVIAEKALQARSVLPPSVRATKPTTEPGAVPASGLPGAAKRGGRAVTGPGADIPPPPPALTGEALAQLG